MVGQTGLMGGFLKSAGWNPLMNYDSVVAVFRAQSPESLCLVKRFCGTKLKKKQQINIVRIRK